MSPNTPLTDEQHTALAAIRAMYASALGSLPPGVAESVDQRARQPDPESLPADVTVRVEIAPPSPQPHPLLRDTGVLKTPERVPLYFFSLRNDHAESESDTDLTDTRVIFFIHGGGNITGHPTHLPFTQLYSKLLRAVAAYSGDAATTTKCTLIAPSYRLATIPENAFPAALQDLVAAYDYVIGKAYDPSNIYIAGDSAGGNHALVLTHLILESGRPAPQGIIAIAPGTVKTLNPMSEHVKSLAGKDIFDMPVYRAMSRAYIGDSGVSRTDPLVSGACLPFAPQWPRTLIFIGTSDHLIDAAREVKRRLAVTDTPVELVEYEERPHGWWVMPHIFPENMQDAAERFARFVLQGSSLHASL